MLSHGWELPDQRVVAGRVPGWRSILIVLGINLFNLFGDALRDAIDPRLKV
jgi:ABC-type dipeptide/oligopeptide/nickel transport system permease subunit